jgi:predicted DsbA family dithiol-disulfide isomerase
VLGAEQDIVANHVLTGQVKMVYWPMLDLGPNSTNAAAAAFCAGEQDPADFWRMHHYLFENQRGVYLANRPYFLEAAATLGLDGPAFEACYDSDGVRAELQQLDETRRANTVSQRPTFDLVSAAGEQRILGSQSYETFESAILSLLP